MTDYKYILQSLLSSIISNPDEDTPRLMYADALQESDDKLDNTVGEFIRYSIELHQHKQLSKTIVDKRLKKIQFSTNNQDYPIPILPSYKLYQEGIRLNNIMDKLWLEASQHPYYKQITSIIPAIDYEVERGFIKSISCRADIFLKVWDQLLWYENIKDRIITDNIYFFINKPCPFTAHPIRKISISLVEDLSHRMTDNSKIRYWEEVLAPKYGIEFTITDENNR